MNFSSSEAKSAFEYSLEAGGGCTWASLKVGLNASVSNSSVNKTQSTTIELNATTLGGDQGAFMEHFTGDPNKLQQEILDGIKAYRKTLHEFGTVIMLDLCAIEPSICRALQSQTVEESNLYQKRSSKAFACLIQVEEQQASLKMCLSSMEQAAKKLPEVVQESEECKEKMKPLSDAVQSLNESLGSIQSRMEHYLTMPVGRLLAVGESTPSEQDETLQNGLVNVSETEFQKSIDELKHLQPKIDNLLLGKVMAMSEEDWRELRGGHVAVSKTPVLTDDKGDYKSVGLLENILIFAKGTAKEDAVKKPKSLFCLSIPGKMWDFASGTIDEESGLARAAEQMVYFPGGEDGEDNKVLDFKVLPRSMRRLKYWGKKTWIRDEVVEVTYNGFWKNDKFHGRGALEFNWESKFEKGRAAHCTVQKIEADFENGACVGSATVHYSKQNASIGLDIKEYFGPCLLEEEPEGNTCFWKVLKHGEGTARFFSSEKTSKDRWEKDLKISHLG